MPCLVVRFCRRTPGRSPRERSKPCAHSRRKENSDRGPGRRCRPLLARCGLSHILDCLRPVAIRDRFATTTHTTRKWRNWQTHQLEGLAVAIPWGFESPLPHQNSRVPRFPGAFRSIRHLRDLALISRRWVHAFSPTATRRTSASTTANSFPPVVQVSRRIVESRNVRSRSPAAARVIRPACRALVGQGVAVKPQAVTCHSSSVPETARRVRGSSRVLRSRQKR